MFKPKIRFALISGSLVLGTLGILIFSPTASAVPPYFPMLESSQYPLPANPSDIDKWGEWWQVDVFRDPSSDHSFLTSLKVCFQYKTEVMMQDEYIWCAPTYNWRGIARKEGDQVFMHNSIIKNLYSQHNYAHWEVVSKDEEDRDEGAGHWRFWMPSLTMFDLNARFSRLGDKCTCAELEPDTLE